MRCSSMGTMFTSINAISGCARRRLDQASPSSDKCMEILCTASPYLTRYPILSYAILMTASPYLKRQLPGDMTGESGSTRTFTDASGVFVLNVPNREANPTAATFTPTYYGAYFRDTEGNKICVACHSPS